MHWLGWAPGTLNGTAVDFRFDGIQKRQNTFLPAEFFTGPFQYVREFVPVIVSEYGTVGTNAGVGGKLIKAGVPVVKTSYDIPLGVGVIRWGMVSTTP